jgi:hypothetical protein
MAFNERLTEQLAVVATLDPTTGLSAIAATDVFSMSMHRRAMFILMTGDTVGTGVLCNIEEGPVVGMTGSAAILTLAATACTAVDSQYLFEVSGEAMATGNSFLRGRFTPTGATILAVVVLADVERYHPASDRDLATVVSIQAAN